MHRVATTLMMGMWLWVGLGTVSQAGGVSTPVKGRDWPAQYGEASVCLWKNDAMAAFSITIDDNGAPFHAWWLEMTEKYGIKPTWFVITGGILTNGAAYAGTWEAFNKLAAAGHDIQSHSVTHLNTNSPLWRGIEAEYADSQKVINERIKGARCLVLAYPGGGNTSLNDPAIAAKYYVGARGTRGAMNGIGKTDYMHVNSMGSVNIGDAKFAFQEFTNLFNAASGAYRGWYCVHFHGVTPPMRDNLEKKLAMISSLVASNEVWSGWFREISQYGQERDSAELKVREVAPGKIVLSLGDKLDNTRFDYPLTIKVRLAADWKGLRAEQGGKPLPAKIIEREGAVFALIQAVPDQGEICLQY